MDKYLNLEGLKTLVKKIEEKVNKKADKTIVSTSSDGLVPKTDGSTNKYFRADGTWAGIDTGSISGDLAADKVVVVGTHAGSLQEVYDKNMFTWSQSGKPPAAHGGAMYINVSPDNTAFALNGNVYFDKGADAWNAAVRVPGLDDSYGWWIKTPFQIKAPSSAKVFYGVGFAINSPSDGSGIGAEHFNNTRAALGTDGYFYVVNMDAKPVNADGTFTCVYTGRWQSVEQYVTYSSDEEAMIDEGMMVSK